MRRYYIEDDANCFWCEHDFGYWSDFKSSLEYRFQGILLWVLPLFLLMKLCSVKCKLKEKGEMAR